MDELTQREFEGTATLEIGVNLKCPLFKLRALIPLITVVERAEGPIGAATGGNKFSQHCRDAEESRVACKLFPAMTS